MKILRFHDILWAVDESSELDLNVESGPTPGAVTLTLQRPHRKNALTPELVQRLGRALDDLIVDSNVRVFILRGAGGAFCSGADLNTIGQAQGDEGGERIDEFHHLIRTIVYAPQPVIAVVDGPAVGFGADLALSCDLRVFSESGYLEEGFVKVGLMPDGGGTYFMPRFAGARAFEYLALGTRLPAARCAELGIANWVVPADQLDPFVQQCSRDLCQAAPLALRNIKAAVRATDRAQLGAVLAGEKAGQTQLLGSNDFQEGVRAFLEKRA
ncbi:MAG TPA: enoyl-CoA hydratase-related protein, partial [Polyangiaceae bacterium]|nr:enoyl-CoA hydratase-related protein [Polyangiaceae bacterium]